MPFPIAGALIGGGLGLASSLFGPKERQTTQQYQIDPRTQQYLGQSRQQALQQAQAGPNQFLTQAGEGYGGLASSNLGFAQQRGMGGIEDYYNPYQQEVIGGMQSDFDRQRQMAQRSGQQMATRQGAFGGSRSAILEAELMGGVNRNEAQALGQLRYGGYSQAGDRLMADRRMAGNLGLAGLGGMAGVGQTIGGQQLGATQNLWGGIGPPQGTGTYTEPIYNNPWAGLIGGATAGAGFQERYG